MTVAWVFPGQGSQKKGMSDVVIDFPGARERFEFASELLGRDLLKICEAKDLNELQPSDINDTRNTQPALFVVESLIVDELRKKGQSPSFVAGHSLGEIVALYAADVLDMETALRLLKRRSELMASSSDGAMSAVVGFDRNQLDDLISSTKGVVIANDNSSSQVVISGTPSAVQSVTSKLTCKRAIPLQVSGAFHSPLMEQASTDFATELDQVSFKTARIPLLSNSDPTPCINGVTLKERLKRQMTTGVRWRETMEEMVRQGITTLVEIGPGNVLSGLAKRSLKDVVINQIASASDLGY